MSSTSAQASLVAEPPAEAARGQSAPEEGATLAAVDLGSNSFHLVVARLADDHVHVIDRLREPVRLAAGLGEEKLLDEEAMLRALDCLGRFAQRLRHMPPGSVRAVGTNTLRSAHNGEEFRRRAEAVLGRPIEVIAGREEARLIYLGVAQGLGGNAERRLVVDIGGGSTELIIGRHTRPVRRESLYMGCVNMSRRFFPDGAVSRARLREAELEARVELEPHETRFRRGEWEMAVGCSGTIRAVATVCQSAGWCEHGITREALDKLRARLVDAGSVSELKLKDLREDRVPVFAGGVAVLGGIFDALGVEYMDISDMALREGLLYDL
ncbi:MAG: exopolyphosphatase, partial [Gammaproteobacteria bacterium]|nr:exopolyphosphatase [Gammaproteobacteria bacterium]